MQEVVVIPRLDARGNKWHTEHIVQRFRCSRDNGSDVDMLHGEESKNGRNVHRQETSSIQAQTLDRRASQQNDMFTVSAERRSAGESGDARQHEHSASSRDMQSDEDSAAASSLGAWYTSVVSTIESLTVGPPSARDSGSISAGNRDAIDPTTGPSDAGSISWMTSAMKQLDELTMEVQAMAWGKPAPTEPTTASDVDSNSASTSLKQQLLDQIGAAQAQLGQKIDEARAALENAVQGMLPEQLQRPWISASAQLCLDPETHPELSQSASVRIGADLCGQEHDFRQQRTERMRKDFAQFIGVAAATVDERDIPVIGVAGSGGGFRAMVSTVGSYRAMYQAGLSQCVMYDAAVSGSSWAVGALHTYGNGDPHKVLSNLRLAMQSSMFGTANLMAFVSENGGIAQRVFADMAARYLLSAAETDTTQEDTSAVESKDVEPVSRQHEGTSVIGMVFDEVVRRGQQVAESVLPEYFLITRSAEPIAAPAPATVSDYFQTAKKALQSMPIPPVSVVELYGALLFKHLIVQHTAGEDEQVRLTLDPRWTKLSAQRTAVDRGLQAMPIYTAVRHFIGSNDNSTEQSASDHKYQWFEFSPYEVGSIDHGAWVPSWAFGRPMKNGREQYRVGEVHFGSILGAVASAFCASVDAMATEIYMAAPTALRSAIMDPLLDRYERDTAVSHLIPPYTLFNPFYRTEDERSMNEHEQDMAELEAAPLLSLMDAGLENNMPFASLLRADRGVDMILCLDSSANIDIMPWFARAERWASDHGVRRWPWGARPWASDPLRPTKIEAEMNSTTLRFTKQAAEQIERRIKNDNVRCVVFDGPVAPSPATAKREKAEPPPISILYLPLMGNREFRKPGFDPQTADFCTTFNHRWTAEQVDLLADLTTFNFNQELEQIRQAVKRAYERKRSYRLYTEQEQGDGAW
ncbi:hypothetical protein GGI19_003853 [Coemansia pectinata]|uniref:Lysophospholipase n=1 Tax=Coemansia pectinata TaxID=1052879 RepID=A0A9W8GSW3_9FUNG|nr:hypothetical protein GGI19_003853 [Coemansia pectinata]